jgi:hypothetical protein
MRYLIKCPLSLPGDRAPGLFERVFYDGFAGHSLRERNKTIPFTGTNTRTSAAPKITNPPARGLVDVDCASSYGFGDEWHRRRLRG